MQRGREVLTFQFGNYSNYIGTHWWNLQESGFNYDPQAAPSTIHHDTLYREGVNLERQATYTPRLLLVDLDGTLKHLPEYGELYGNSIKRHPSAEATGEQPEAIKKLKEDVEWKDDGVEVLAKPEAPKGDFQKDLENQLVDIYEKDYNFDDVDTWADFQYARYHPRTVNVVKDFKHLKDRQTFDTYSGGVSLWRTEAFSGDFCDKIRQYVEECDYMQGFQTLFDCYNGFSGLATQCLEHLNDEYSKANLVVPVFSPQSTLYENADEFMSDSIRVVNSALAFNQLREHASLFVPLSVQDRVWRQLGASRLLKYIHYQADNLYQTSAILAAYLDTISLHYRLKETISSNSLSDLCYGMTRYGRKLAAAAIALPFPMKHNEDLIDCLDKLEGPLLTQLTPSCSIGTKSVVQTLCVRGIPKARLKRPREQARLQMQMEAYKCNSVSEMFQLYLQCGYHSSMAHVSAVEPGMPTRISFPSKIFDEEINPSGFFTPLAKRSSKEKVMSVPTLAAIQSSSELGDTLETLHREAKRVKVAKLHRFESAGLDKEEYDEALENLLLFKDEYENNFHL